MRWSVIAVLGEIVSANFLRAVARLDLPAALGGHCLMLLLLLHFIESRAQHAHGLGAIFDLRFLVLLRNHQPAGNVCDAHRRIRGVHRLPARSGRTERVDAQVFRLDLDVDVVRLRKHRHRRGGGVNAALLLGGGHPLHAMHAALVL